jgi:hypothetical protein
LKRVIAIAALGVALVLPAAVAAQPVDERPWAVGVEPAKQRVALELFRRGNVHFAEKEYTAAAEIYREALTHWDHPAIHGNLAVTLVHLDDPLGANEEIERALRFGAAPFEPTVHDQLLTSHKLLQGQLSTVEIVCNVPGADISLDGARVLGGKGVALSMIRIGPHQVVASKPAHLTFTQQFNALPGQVMRIEINLVPLGEAGGYQRKWAVWKPWVVVGTGAALVVLAAPFELAARNNIDGYEQEIARSCPNGCTSDDLPAAVRDLATRGRWQSRLAVGSLITGSVIAAAGAYLVYDNRLRRVRLDESGRQLAAAPVALPGGAGIAVLGSF